MSFSVKWSSGEVLMGDFPLLGKQWFIGISRKGILQAPSHLCLLCWEPIRGTSQTLVHPNWTLSLHPRLLHLQSFHVRQIHSFFFKNCWCHSWCFSVPHPTMKCLGSPVDSTFSMHVETCHFSALPCHSPTSLVHAVTSPPVLQLPLSSLHASSLTPSTTAPTLTTHILFPTQMPEWYF